VSLNKQSNNKETDFFLVCEDADLARMYNYKSGLRAPFQNKGVTIGILR
jgi:hypothetical protein